MGFFDFLFGKKKSPPAPTPPPVIVPPYVGPVVAPQSPSPTPAPTYPTITSPVADPPALSMPAISTKEIAPCSIYGAIPAWENGVTTGNDADTNTKNLNELVTSVSTQGGGEIVLHVPGRYLINDTIWACSNVSVRGVPGSVIAWTGSARSNIIESSSGDTIHNFKATLTIDETGLLGAAVRLHSGYNNEIDVVGIGAAPASTFFYASADSTGNSGMQNDRNFVCNKIRVRHFGSTGTFIRTDGIKNGLNNNAQVVTLNEFTGCQAASVNWRGIKLDSWSDTNSFTGMTRMNMTGRGSVGIYVNEIDPQNETGVYDNVFDFVAIDTFGDIGERTGVILNASKAMICNMYFQDPVAERGSFVADNCISYRWLQKVDGSNALVEHEKNMSVG